MNVISIHSHKGGAGKTTLTLMIAKAKAMRGKKVCAVDLDFIGSGFEHLLDVPSPMKFLDAYVTKDPGSPKLPGIDEMVTHYSDEDLGDNKLHLIFNLAGSNNKREEKLKSSALIGLEPNQNIVGRAIAQLLSDLEEEGYETVLLDCHPGLAYLSKSILKLGKKGRFGKLVSIFMTTSNRAHFHGMLNELSTMSSEEYGELFNPSQSILCLNRSVPDLYGTWKNIVSSVRNERVHKGEAMTRVSTFEDICSKAGGVNYICVQEYEAILRWGGLGGRGKIILPEKGTVKYSDTLLCNNVLEGIVSD